jgi:glycosyltransferase involved in cell wall biosynthesis
MVIRPDEGGAFRHLADLSRGVTAAGHDVAVCGPLAHRADDLDAEVIPLPMTRAIDPRADLASLRGLARIVRAWRPDLIHAHGSKGAVYARVGRPAYPRVPVIYTPHGYPFAGSLPAPARKRYKQIERLLSRLSTMVICVCEAERRLALSVGTPRTTVVHNGTEPDPPRQVASSMEALRGGGPVVVAVTGLRPGKGVETLVESWPAVLERRPEAVLAIAGDGIERQRINDLMVTLGIERSVHLLGNIEPAELALWGADLFVSPSWAESFPYAVLEAMAVGLPTVATDVGGTREAVEEGVTGRLVPPRDSAALATAVADVLADGDQLRTMGAAARRRHLERFTVQRMVEATLAVYEETGRWRSDNIEPPGAIVTDRERGA